MARVYEMQEAFKPEFLATGLDEALSYRVEVMEPLDCLFLVGRLGQ